MLIRHSIEAAETSSFVPIWSQPGSVGSVPTPLVLVADQMRDFSHLAQPTSALSSFVRHQNTLPETGIWANRGRSRKLKERLVGCRSVLVLRSPFYGAPMCWFNLSEQVSRSGKRGGFFGGGGGFMHRSRVRVSEVLVWCARTTVRVWGVKGRGGHVQDCLHWTVCHGN